MSFSPGVTLAPGADLPHNPRVVDTVPALIVSGFLGSGKTTLVRWLLEDAQRNGVRVAVISNEFGELGIDEALLGDGGEAYVEIEGGCVCCKLSDELVETLQTLRERVDPERVIVETSGVALPHETQLNFWREPVCQWAGEDVAVVVVNAEQVAAGRDLEGTFEDQVSSADLLLLNQIDRVAGAELDRVEAELARRAPDVPIVRCVRGRVDPALFFTPERVPARARSPREPQPHTHESFEAVELVIDPGATPDELRARLAAYGALRIKGFVDTSEGPRLVQGVGPRIELEPASPPRPELANRLVLIRRP